MRYYLIDAEGSKNVNPIVKFHSSKPQNHCENTEKCLQRLICNLIGR